MYKVAAFLALLSLTACDIEGQDYRDADSRESNINKEIQQKGFAVVGKTPDGKPLLMTEVSYGHGSDRVYFAGNSITANENCGKNCEHSITTSSK